MFVGVGNSFSCDTGCLSQKVLAALRSFWVGRVLVLVAAAWGYDMCCLARADQSHSSKVRYAKVGLAGFGECAAVLLLAVQCSRHN